MAGRTDKNTDSRIAQDLLLARRGQAFFSRKLNELRDADFDSDSLLDGWSRRHVIAHVGYNARAITRLVEWAATGVETPMYGAPDQRRSEIDLGATLPPIALRNLSDHAAVHLTVEWRDLDAEHWSNPVRTALGREVPVSETPWMRAREVWIHAVDLNNGADFEQFPGEFIDRLIIDITSTWRVRHEQNTETTIELNLIDRDESILIGAADQGIAELTVTGRATDIARWAAGRGNRGVTTADGHPAPAAPRWI